MASLEGQGIAEPKIFAGELGAVVRVPGLPRARFRGRDQQPENQTAGVAAPGSSGARATAILPLDQLSAPYLEIMRSETGRRFFNGLSWYTNFHATCMEPGTSAIVLTASAALDGAQHHGALVLQTPMGRPGNRIANQPTGRRTLMSLTNYQSEHFAPIISDPEAAEPIARALAVALHRYRPSWSILNLDHLDFDDPCTAAFAGALAEQGLSVFTIASDQICFERINGRSYAEFLKGRSAKFRSLLRGNKRKLDGRGKARFEIVTGSGDIEAAIRDYQAVFDSSWKESETHPQHVPGLIRAAARDEALRLALLYVDDVPIATEMAILSGDKACCHKAHYNEDYRNTGVGYLMTAHLLEHLIDHDRIAEVDFGMGDAPYKLKWLKERRSSGGLVAFNTRTIEGLIGKQRYELSLMAARAKTFAKPYAEKLLPDKVLARLR